MYVDEKNLEGKKNALSDVITFSLCLSRDTTWSRDTQSTMEESCFQQKFLKKRPVFITLHPLFNWQEDIQQVVCWPE